MIHLVAFTESQDSAVLVPIAAAQDQAIQVNGDDVIVPNDLPFLIGSYALGPNLTRAQLQSPQLRQMFNQEIYGLDVSATPTDQLLLEWYGQDAISLKPGEQLNALMAESNAAASRGTVLAWIADGTPQPMSADFRTIRVTSTTAAVANIWSNITLAFNDVLPAGLYALMGMQLQSTNGQAFRVVGKGDPYRCGGIMQTAITQRQHPVFRHGNMGEWTRFQHNVPPSVDVLCNGADAAFAGVMDVLYLG